MNYQDLVTRNQGYIAPNLQATIRKTRLLVAGCGIGSAVAETAVRLGFTRITLVDGDIVEPHNLNRQLYEAQDVGSSKVHSLERRLVNIAPQVEIHAHHGWVDAGSARKIVDSVDVIVDTIDFFDLPAIISLHDECTKQSKPLISALPLGWGAGVIYFPAGGTTLREMLGIAPDMDVDGESYLSHYQKLVSVAAEQLAPEVVSVFVQSLAGMADGKPCPASQLAVGAAATAGLVMTALVRILAEKPVISAPRLIVANLAVCCDSGPAINLAPNISC